MRRLKSPPINRKRRSLAAHEILSRRRAPQRHGIGYSAPAMTRLTAPAAERNKRPIVDALQPYFAGRSGDVLEIGAGTGQHAATLAEAFPDLTFWPTDPDPRHLASIDAWQLESGYENLRPAQALDLLSAEWGLGGNGMAPSGGLTAILCINVIHITAFAVSEALFARARPLIRADGLLYLYGPFKRDGRHTADSNVRFDAQLRMQNPDWGVRDLGKMENIAEAGGLALSRVKEMPANNLSLFFEPTFGPRPLTPEPRTRRFRERN